MLGQHGRDDGGAGQTGRLEGRDRLDDGRRRFGEQLGRIRLGFLRLARLGRREILDARQDAGQVVEPDLEILQAHGFVPLLPILGAEFQQDHFSADADLLDLTVLVGLVVAVRHEGPPLTAVDTPVGLFRLDPRGFRGIGIGSHTQPFQRVTMF